MSKAPPSYDFYPGDFHRSTRAFTFEQKALYRELMDEQWEHGHIPNDKNQMMLIARITDKSMFEALWDVVKKRFVDDGYGNLINPRMHSDRQRAIRRWEANKENGKKGGRPPKKPKPNPGETQTKPTRKGKGKGKGKVEVEDDWIIPEHLDSEKVRAELSEFVSMRSRIKKPIRSLRNSSRSLKAFTSQDQLLRAIDHVIGNEYQGLKPEYGDEKRNGKKGNRDLTSGQKFDPERATTAM